MKKYLIAAALGLAFVMPQAEAALFNFSYTTEGGDVLAGQLDGTLQGDNNTVIVNSILDFVTFNGVNGASLASVRSEVAFSNEIDFNNAPPGLLPSVTLNGSVMDLTACEFSPCSDVAFGFFFWANTPIAVFPSSKFAGSFSHSLEEYNPDHWHLSPVQAVPVPAAIWLFGSGLAGLFGMRRKRNFAA